MQLKHVTCLICNSNESVPFKEVVNRFNLDEKFKLVSCEKCGFVYLNPRPCSKSLDLFYQDDRYQPHQLEIKSVFDKLYNVARFWNNRYKRYLIERYVQNGELLDFGCGSGEFLLSMREAGWNVFGVERAQKPKYFATNLGLTIQDTIDNFDKQFDVITLWHVLEHIDDVHLLIEELKKRLTGSGLMVIAVPNLKCYDAEKYSLNWIAYDVPRHLSHFNPYDMYRLFKIHGMQIIDLKTLYIDTWYNSMLSWNLESHRTKYNVLGGIFKCSLIGLLSTVKETINRFYSSSIIYIICNK